MEKEYKNPFHTLVSVTPEKGLGDKIIRQIKTNRIHTARIHLALFGTISLISLVAIFPAFQYVGQSLYRSGSYEYFSLLFSEGTTLLPYWKEFLFTVTESLPILEITAILAVIYVLLESAKLTIQNTFIAFQLKTN